jgi:thioredoxin reductase (NADPH)
MLSGRPSLVRARATEPGEVIELDHAQLMSLVQNDSELSDILMRAFILRRVELIAHGFGDAVLLGSNHCGGTLRIREFLNRNGHPHRFVDLGCRNHVQQLLDRSMSASAMPGAHRPRSSAEEPVEREIAGALGFNTTLDESLRDLVIAGADPQAFGGSQGGAPEGLDVLSPSRAPGDRRIELQDQPSRLPTGVSGAELTGRAFTQPRSLPRPSRSREAPATECDRRPAPS